MCGEMYTHAETRADSTTPALSRSLTTPLATFIWHSYPLRTADATGSAREKSVLTRVHLSRRSWRLVSLWLCRANPNPFELMVGATANSWLVQANENER